MAESPCPYCGYDLSGIAFTSGERLCPECSGASRFATLLAPWWVRRPWHFDAAILAIGVPWALVAKAFDWMYPGDSRSVLPYVVPGTIVLAVVCGIGWILGLERSVRKKLGKNLISPWVPAWHSLVAVFGIPMIWAFMVVSINLVGFLWRGR